MTESLRIRKNSIFSLISISSRLISNIIVFLIIARYFGPEIFGQFTLAHTLATVSILFGDFGFDILLTTEIARNREKTAYLFQRYFSLKLLFSSSALIFMWCLSIFGDFSQEAKLLILIFSFYMLFTTLTNFLYAFYKGLEKLEYETGVSVFINVSLLIITLILLATKAGIFFISVAFVISRVLGFVAGVFFTFKLLPGISYGLTFKGISEVRNKILVFGLHLLFSNLYFQLDTILLGLWKGDYEVGIYQSVFKLIMLPLVIPDIFNNSLIPVLSRLNIENNWLWKKIGSVMNKFLLVIILPVFIILFSFSKQIINLVYGAKLYSGAIPVLKIFSFILLVRFLSETYALMLTTSNKQHVRMVAVIFATAINFTLNYFLIPEYGVIGASIVSLITSALIGFVYIYFNFNLFFDFMFNVKTLGILLFAIFISLIVNNYEFNFILASVVIILLFSVVGWFFFSSEERKKIVGKELKLKMFG